MTQIYQYPIVGSKYRPPADDILDTIPLQAKLVLRADPHGQNSGTSHNDPTAIAVYITWADQTRRTLEAVAGRIAHRNPDLTDLLGHSDGWHVGYIPKDAAAYLRQNCGFPLHGEVDGEFCLKSNSRLPHVKFTIDQEANT